MYRYLALLTLFILSGCSSAREDRTGGTANTNTTAADAEIKRSFDDLDRKPGQDTGAEPSPNLKNRLAGTWVSEPFMMHITTYQFDPDGHFKMTNKWSDSGQEAMPPVVGRWRRVSQNEIEHTWEAGWQRCRVEFRDHDRRLVIWDQDNGVYPENGHLCDKQ